MRVSCAAGGCTAACPARCYLGISELSASGGDGGRAALWLANEIAIAFALEAPLFLVRDNDQAYGASFRRRLRRMGVRDSPTQPHSPWQNGHVERLIGSIRRECLDHHLILSASHLRRVLDAYAGYYNNDRTHLALAKDSPAPRPVEHVGRLAPRPILGGLHRRYTRIGSK